MTFAAFGLLIALGIGMLWWALSNQVGEPPAPAATSSSVEMTAPSADAAATSGPDAAASTATPDGADVSNGVAAATKDPAAATKSSAPEFATLPASEPVSVRIPSIDVDSPLHALGLKDDGTLEVPTGELLDEAAWYDGSPTPGESGPAVIEGHVTSPRSGPSVFFELGALTKGDLVEVDRADGLTATFEVYGAKSFPKNEFPRTTVYGNTAGPELRLITCGGVYDDERGTHLDNIVVFARLVP